MAATKKPWEDVVSFDDWKQEVNDDSQTEEPGKSYAQNSAPQEIQGIGISNDDEDIDLNDMIANLNQQNAGYVEKAKAEEKEQREKVREAEQEEERKRKEEILRAKFEAESAERERIAFEEAEAYAAAEREKREKSFKAVTSKFFRKKPKEEPTDTENMEVNEMPDASDIPDKEKLSENKDMPETVTETPSGSPEEIAKEVEEPKIDSETKNEPSAVAPAEPKGRQSVTKVKNREKMLEQKRIEREMRRQEEELQNKEELSESVETVLEEEKISDDSKSVENTEDQDKSSSLSGSKESVSPVKTKEESTEELVVDDTESKSINTEKSSKKNTNKKTQPQKEAKEKKPFFLFGKKQTEPKESVAKNQASKSDSNSKDSKNSKDVEKPDWEFLATHDEMTGLLNQRAFEEQKSLPRKKPYAVVYVDVNNLKYANDTLGHAAGNKLIIATAELMKKLFPDCSYRIGGDEFVAVMEYPSVKKIEKELLDKKNSFNNAMLEKSKEEKESGLVYAASFGYSYTDGSKSFEEVSAEADKAMYAVKEAYKKANPQFDMRSGKGRLPDKKKQEPPKDYDSLLTAEQRGLKTTIKNNHRPVSAQSTSQILRDVQSKASEVIAILIADPNFDQLFIILKPEVFINIVTEMEAMIDYSYLYILYEGGPQYKGSDEYLSEVTHIFEAIGNGIKSGRIRSEKDFQKIKGINVFKNIYVDM